MTVDADDPLKGSFVMPAGDVMLDGLFIWAAPYVECSWDAAGNEVQAEEKYCTEFQLVSPNLTDASGWYVLDRDVTLSKRLTVSGDTSLILSDGAVTCTECGFDSSNVPVFKSHTLLLSGQIGVNFYVDLSKWGSSDLELMTMEFTVNGKTTTASVDENFTNPGGDGYYGFTCYINSVQMADEITATLHYGEDQTVSETYSAAKYIAYVQGHPDQYSANAVALVNAIADYGHYVQPFLAQNNNWTIGTDHAEISGASTYGADEVSAAKEAAAAHAIVRDLGSSQIEKVTYSLNLESETAIRTCLKVKDGYTGGVTATVGGKAVDCVKQKDGRYRIEITGISAHKPGDTYEVVVSAGGTCTVSVSALSYVNTVLNSDSNTFNNDTAHYAVTSLYRYYAAADAYKKQPKD